MVAYNGVLVENNNENNNNIEELLKILIVYNKLNEERQINILLEQMKEMEKNYSEVLKELTAVKRQLDKVQIKNLAQEISPMMNEESDRIAGKYNYLQEIGRNLNEKAKQIVDRFKELGISALNNVCDFLGIKERLIALRDNVRSGEMTMKNSMEKIEKVEFEFGNAVFHVKNAVRAVAGKEISDEANREKNQFFDMLKTSCLKQQKKYSQRYEKINKAIEKFDSLEKAASASEERNSIKDKLSDNKKIIDSREMERKGSQQQIKQHEHDNNER